MSNRTLASNSRNWGMAFSCIAAAGFFITISAIWMEPAAKTYVLQPNGNRFVPEPPDKTWEEIYVEWAPHFGPELIILGFAGYFVELGLEKERQRLEKEKQRNVLRRELVEYLGQLLRYADDNNGFFAGDLIMTLENETDTLRHIWMTRPKG